MIKFPDSVAARMPNSRFAVPRNVVIEKRDTRGNNTALLGVRVSSAPTHVSSGIEAALSRSGNLERRERVLAKANYGSPAPTTIDRPIAHASTRAIRPLGPNDSSLSDPSTS